MSVEVALITLGTVAVRTATKLWLGDHKWTRDRAEVREHPPVLVRRRRAVAAFLRQVGFVGFVDRDLVSALRAEMPRVTVTS